MNPLYWVAFKTIVRKEYIRYMRIWGQTLIPPVMNTALYIIIFGHFLGNKIGTMAGVPYLEYLIPGMIISTIINNSYSNVVSSFYSSKSQKVVEELLVSPIPSYIIVWGYVMGGVSRSILVALLIGMMTTIFVPIHIYNVVVLISVTILTSLIFSLGGLINAVYAKTYDHVSFIPNFILTPLNYVGGVFYSITILPPFWSYLSHFNPIVYMVNAFRYGFIGKTDVSLTISYFVLVSLSVILYLVACQLIKRGIGLKT